MLVLVYGLDSYFFILFFACFHLDKYRADMRSCNYSCAMHVKDPRLAVVSYRTILENTRNAFLWHFLGEEECACTALIGGKARAFVPWTAQQQRVVTEFS